MKRVLVYGMTNNPGGIETYVQNLFDRIRSRGVLLDFVSDFPSVSGGELLEAQGAHFYFIPAKSKDLPGHLMGMRRILQAHPEYETVYFNILDAGAAVTMLPVFLSGRRIVVHSHNNDTDKQTLHKLCRPLLNLMAAGTAACSQSAAAYMFGSRADRAIVIPNAIDAAKFTFREPVRAELRRSMGLEGRLAVCHVGRISRQKNPLGLIDIFEQIHLRHPDSVLLSIGGGEMEAEFRAYIAQKNLSDSVMVLGVRQDVAALLQAADVFLFPSLYEGLGIAVLEAQAAGLPCVVSDAVPAQALVTDLVRSVPLADSAAVWATHVLEMARMPRRNTLQEMKTAGYDLSCCAEHDTKLLDILLR